MPSKIRIAARINGGWYFAKGVEELCASRIAAKPPAIFAPKWKYLVAYLKQVSREARYVVEEVHVFRQRPGQKNSKYERLKQEAGFWSQRKKKKKPIPMPVPGPQLGRIRFAEALAGLQAAERVANNRVPPQAAGYIGGYQRLADRLAEPVPANRVDEWIWGRDNERQNPGE